MTISEVPEALDCLVISNIMQISKRLHSGKSNLQ